MNPARSHSETKAKLSQVIDERVGADLPELIREQALHTQMLSLTDIERIRRDMEEARTRRLQPHHIEGFFRGALAELRGRIAPRQRSTLRSARGSIAVESTDNPHSRPTLAN